MVLVGSLALAGVLVLSGCSRATDQPALNIVLIVIDDMGWMDASVYGSTFYDTPNIDRLAAQGARFTPFLTASPVCSPTRASFIEVTHSRLVAPFVAKGMSLTFRGGARPSGRAFLRLIGPTGRGVSTMCTIWSTNKDTFSKVIVIFVTFL